MGHRLSRCLYQNGQHRMQRSFHLYCSLAEHIWRSGRSTSADQNNGAVTGVEAAGLGEEKGEFNRPAATLHSEFAS
jgi:hypothetical protein